MVCISRYPESAILKKFQLLLLGLKYKNGQEILPLSTLNKLKYKSQTLYLHIP
mgnify:CR=1 FL=1